MEMTLKEMGEYLKNLREQKGLSTREVYDLSKVSNSYLSLVENGHRRASAVVLKKLAPVYGVDYLDLYVKAGYADLAEYEKNKTDEFGNPVVSIPLLGTVKAGYDYLAQENWEGTIDIKEELAKTGEFFALRIKGNSMFETLWDGDIVAVKKQDFAKDGDIAVVIINGDEATVKKIRILDNGIKLMPLNRRINPETQEPYYEDITFTKKEIETKPVKIVGIVRRLIERDFK